MYFSPDDLASNMRGENKKSVQNISQ